MVSAPIYVAQMQMAKLWDPENKTRAFGVGYQVKTKKYEKYDKENAKNDSGAPWRIKRESNQPINAINMQVFEEKYDKLYAGKYAQNWAKLTLTAT